METLTYIVQEFDDNQRLDKLIANRFVDFSRNQIKKMLEDKLITVNKKYEKASYNVNCGDCITIILKNPENLEIKPEKIPLDIYYEDDDLLVVNKPSNMVVHPANGNLSATLVNALLSHCNNLSKINGMLRPGIVHRIDKDTSGLLVVAKNDQIHLTLASQFKEKTVKREYLALCYGKIKHDKGTIDAPIGRDKNNRKKMKVIDGGRSSVTHFEVVERLGQYTFVKCKLETGRTHQIRVHLNYIGNPLVGDIKYGPRKVIGKNGQFLHAYILGFTHPRNNVFMEFEAPLPDYYSKFLSRCRQQSR